MLGPRPSQKQLDDWLAEYSDSHFDSRDIEQFYIEFDGCQFNLKLHATLGLAQSTQVGDAWSGRYIGPPAKSTQPTGQNLPVFPDEDIGCSRDTEPRFSPTAFRLYDMCPPASHVPASLRLVDGIHDGWKRLLRWMFISIYQNLH